MEVHTLVKMFVSAALLGVIGLILRVYRTVVVEPERLRSKLRKQGISGPPPTFLFGNIGEIKAAATARSAKPVSATTNPPAIVHDCATALFPFFKKWTNLYGQIFLFSMGNIQILHVNQPDVAKEIITCTSLDLGKPSYQHKERGALLGQGILTSNGTVWAHQRKILAPELYMDKVKGMTSLVTESAVTMVNSWKSKIEREGGTAEIKIDQDMRSFSGDVISRACFGSNYSKGEEIFKRLGALQEALSKKVMSSGIPGTRHLPTKHNRKTWALEKEVRSLILDVVKERTEAGYEKDLLQMVLEGAQNSRLAQPAIEDFVVDNCKNIYLAGYETTAVSATWCLMLLAANQKWQERVRAEVLGICGDQIPNADMIRKMKQLTMVIHETLRLYPPVMVLSREALKDMKFGNIHVPKGVNLWVPTVTLHTDLENWGPDAKEFNPERFAKGITGACKLPHLYMPFGVGPRVCIGQNLAMTELKILVALLLSNFSFKLSPNYVHSAVLSLVIEPEHGVQLLVNKL
ncbi:hypothetical protein U1Q18_033673 [Sarracenia purpurea var. burkii]